jgi:hypothetical protein
MPPNDDAEESPFCESSSDDEEEGSEIQDYNEEDEESEEDNEDTGSQVTMETLDFDFLTPGGLNAFTVALPTKSEKLVLRDLPKTITATSKKNFRVTMNTLNAGISSLRKTAVSENNIARDIHDIAKAALKRGVKSIDECAKKMRVMESDLNKAKAKILKANSDKDTAISEKKAALNTLKEKTDSLKNIEKELADVQKELADTKKEVKSTSGHGVRRDDSVERMREKENIKLDAYERKTEINRRNKEKEERRKRDAKTDNVSTIQALGGRDNPWVTNERQSSSSSSSKRRRGRHHRRNSSRSVSSRSSCSSSRSDSRERERSRRRERSDSRGRERSRHRERSDSRGRERSRRRERSDSRGRERSRRRERSDSRGRERSRRRERSESRGRERSRRRERSESRGRDRSRSPRIARACYEPRLPTHNDQLNQLQNGGLSFANNASGAGNMNDENYDAAGALLQFSANQDDRTKY